MELIPQHLKAKLHTLGRQDSYNPLVVARFNNPGLSRSWFLTDYDSESDIYTAYVMSHRESEDEWLYVSEGDLAFAEAVLDPRFEEMEFRGLGPLRRTLKRSISESKNPF